ncbi:unnamed protein product, partial [Brachionus calyciflorus]
MIKQKINFFLERITTNNPDLREESSSDSFVSKETSLIQSILIQNDMLVCNQTELEKYFSIPLISQNVDPIEWWSSNIKDFPKLSKIAMDYLPAVPTSVLSERYFSTAGITVTKLRNRLSPEK